MIIFITTICVVLIFTFGFIGGVCFAAWGMATKAQKMQDKIFEANSKDNRARRIIPKYQHAFAVAAACWCDPRTCDIKMDPVLGSVFAEKIAVYIEALQWCGGSADFGPDGKAFAGFQKMLAI